MRRRIRYALIMAAMAFAWAAGNAEPVQAAPQTEAAASSAKPLALGKFDITTGNNGFAAFADQLADDYEMGRAVRAMGYTLAIPAMGVGHTATESSAHSVVPLKPSTEPVG